MRSLLSASLVTFMALAMATITTDAIRAQPRGKFASLREEAADFAQLSVPQYVQRLEEALRHAPENQELLQHLNYYRSLNRGGSLKSSVRDVKRGTVHDCVPFELQPALFEASAKEVSEARASWMQATMGGLSSAEAVCHPGSVPIPRPIVKYHNTFVPKLSAVPKKQAPKNLFGSNKRDPIPAGYSYVDSTFANCTPGTQFTYTVLGMGKEVNSSIPSTPFLNDADHSINQMWWVDQNASTNTLDTLEAGWIHSSYWSFFPETMLFVFSTPDGYAGHGTADQYNYLGGFIGYPGSPAVQKGVESVLYMWKWDILVSPTNNTVTGFAMKLTPFTALQNGSYQFGAEIPLGYYPVHRYKDHKAPNFDVLQTGQEMSENANSTQLQAGGKIFGWGTNTEKYIVKGNFTNLGQKMSFNYGTTPGFAPNQYTADNWVAFHGNDCGAHC